MYKEIFFISNRLSQDYSDCNNSEVKKQVDRLKYQAFEALCQEENNWYKLEEDIECLRSFNQVGNTLFYTFGVMKAYHNLKFYKKKCKKIVTP